MRRTLLTLLTLLMLGAGSLSAVAGVTAQDATPAASPGPAGGVGGVVIIGSDGQPVGQVSVNAIQDPFQAFDPGNPPPRGFHYVMADVTVTAGPSAPVEAAPSAFQLVDAEGFIDRQAYVSRSGDTTAQPDFQGGTIEAGKSLSGFVYFQVLEGVKPAIVAYQPDYQRLVTVADLRPSIVKPGTAVAIVSGDGGSTGTVKVDDVVNPMKDFDPGNGPQRGFQFASATVTITNSGTAPLQVSPNQFKLIDTDGFLNAYTGASRSAAAQAKTPDLGQLPEVAGGASVTGVVTFQLLAGTKPGAIIYAPASDRAIRVAEYGAQAPAPSGTPSAVAPPPTVAADVTPETTAAAVPTVELGDVDCTAVAAWVKDLVANFSSYGSIISELSSFFGGTGSPDPVKARAAAKQLNDIADKQAASSPPDVVKPLNDGAVEAFHGMATALNAAADAAEKKDAAGVAAALTAFSSATDKLSGDQFTALSSALSTKCPDLKSVLGG